MRTAEGFLKKFRKSLKERRIEDTETLYQKVCKEVNQYFQRLCCV